MNAQTRTATIFGIVVVLLTMTLVTACDESGFKEAGSDSRAIPAVATSGTAERTVYSAIIPTQMAIGVATVGSISVTTASSASANFHLRLVRGKERNTGSPIEVFFDGSSKTIYYYGTNGSYFLVSKDEARHYDAKNHIMEIEHRARELPAWIMERRNDLAGQLEELVFGEKITGMGGYTQVYSWDRINSFLNSGIVTPLASQELCGHKTRGVRINAERIYPGAKGMRYDVWLTDDGIRLQRETYTDEKLDEGVWCTVLEYGKGQDEGNYNRSSGEIVFTSHLTVTEHSNATPDIPINGLKVSAFYDVVRTYLGTPPNFYPVSWPQGAAMIYEAVDATGNMVDIVRIRAPGDLPFRNSIWLTARNYMESPSSRQEGFVESLTLPDNSESLLWRQTGGELTATWKDPQGQQWLVFERREVASKKSAVDKKAFLDLVQEIQVK